MATSILTNVSAVSCAVRYDRSLSIGLSDGRTILLRPSATSRLARAPTKHLSVVEMSGDEVRWPLLGESLSVCGLLVQAKTAPQAVSVIAARPSRPSLSAS